MQKSDVGWALAALVLVLVVGAAVGYFSGLFYFAGWMPCSPPMWLQVDGVTSAKFVVWNDVNGNATLDSGEAAFKGVTVKLGSEKALTDRLGNAEVWLFRPGCACKCWQEQLAGVEAPTGYYVTTSITLPLIADGETYMFGLKKGAAPQP